MLSRVRSTVAALILCALMPAPMLPGQTRPASAESLERQFQTAASHYDSGQYQQAEKELQNLIQLGLDNFDVEELLGLVYSAESKDQQATAHLEKAIRLKPHSAPARLNLAVNLARLGRSDRAEAEFKRAATEEPGNFNVNHDFGEFYAREGKVKEAIPYLQQAQRADPSDYDNGYDLALAFDQAGIKVEARRQIQALMKSKDTAELHSLLGQVEEESGDYVAAANEYQTAARMEPSESNLFFWGSELLLHQTLNSAIEVFAEGVKRYPKSARMAVGLGLALYWRDRYDDAVKALLSAIDLDPSDPHAYYFLSKAYGHAGSQAKEVIDCFRRFAELRPRDSRAAYYYAMSLWKGNQTGTSNADLSQVEALLKKAVGLDASFAEAHIELGDLYSQEGKYAEAVPEYQRALKLDGELVDAYYRLGQAYVHLGRKDLAQREFEIHDKLYQQHLAKWDAEQRETRQFVLTTRAGNKDSQ